MFRLANLLLLAPLCACAEPVLDPTSSSEPPPAGTTTKAPPDPTDPIPCDGGTCDPGPVMLDRIALVGCSQTRDWVGDGRPMGFEGPDRSRPLQRRERLRRRRRSRPGWTRAAAWTTSGPGSQVMSRPS